MRKVFSLRDGFDQGANGLRFERLLHDGEAEGVAAKDGLGRFLPKINRPQGRGADGDTGDGVRAAVGKLHTFTRAYFLDVMLEKLLVNNLVKLSG